MLRNLDEARLCVAQRLAVVEVLKVQPALVVGLLQNLHRSVKIRLALAEVGAAVLLVQTVLHVDLRI